MTCHDKMEPDLADRVPERAEAEEAAWVPDKGKGKAKAEAGWVASPWAPGASASAQAAVTPQRTRLVSPAIRSSARSAAS